MEHPAALVFDFDGNLVFCDRRNHRLQVFDPAGTFLRVIGDSGTFPLDTPTCICLDNDGNYVVSDTGHHRIQVFSPRGVSLKQFGSKGSGPGQFGEPLGVAVHANGNIYCADYPNHRIQVKKKVPNTQIPLFCLLFLSPSRGLVSAFPPSNHCLNPSSPASSFSSDSRFRCSTLLVNFLKLFQAKHLALAFLAILGGY